VVTTDTNDKKPKIQETMKSAIYRIFIFGALLLGLLSCEDDDSLAIAEVTGVEALYSPEDNRFLNLGAQSSALFEWQHAKSADNGIVLYEVVFDREGGDFSNPVYVVPSDGNGYSNRLNMSFTLLNQIAGMAGIGSETTGKLQWTVWSSKGLDIKKSPHAYTLEVERLGRFPTPDELFITGPGTENGDDVGAAQAFVKTGATTFEIYTQLAPGDFKFISRRVADAESYYLDGENKLKKDGVGTFAGTEAVYRIRLDFSDGSVSLATVDKIELWFPPLSSYLFEFNYAGNGTWEVLDQYIEFKQEGWGRDERYKFRFTVTSDGTTAEEWYGSVNGDNQRPNADTDAAFYYMVPVTNDHWANSFKFREEVDMANSDIRIYFNADVPEYTHEISVR